MRSLPLALSLVAAMSFANMARAADSAPSLGEKGRVILGADRLMSLFSYASVSEDQAVTAGGTTVTTTHTVSGPGVSLLFAGNPARENVHTLPRLSLDYTFLPQWTLGGSIAVAFGLGGKVETKTGGQTNSTDIPSSTTFGFAPRAGYILNINDMFAFWPRAGFAFYVQSSSQDLTTAGVVSTVTDSHTYFSLDLDPQFVFTPFPRIGINVGPLMNIPITGSHHVTTEGGGTTVTVKNDASIFQFGITMGVIAYF